MKKNYLSLVALLVITLGFLSCRKQEIIPATAPVEPPRLLTKIDLNNGAPVLFKYDAGGRITESSNGLVNQKFQYTNNILSGEFSDKNNFVYSHLYDGILDAKGRLTEYKSVYHQPGQPDMEVKYVLTYNADGYLIKSVRNNLATGNFSQDEFIYVDGNLVSDINTVNGQPNYRTEYTHHTDLVNKLSLDFIKTVAGFHSDGLTGKRSKNLIKSIQTFSPQNVMTQGYTFTYTLDTKGFPISYKGKNELINYEYEAILEYNN